MTRSVFFSAAFALLTSAALAHHGWGSYDASKPVTVTGPELTASRELDGPAGPVGPEGPVEP